MAINLHEKWNAKMVKAFTHGSILASRLTDKYSWDGVKTVKISHPVTVAPIDYTRAGASRFGAINDVQDEVQAMTVNQDKCWILSIDAGNASEQQKEKRAAEIITAQLYEQDIPCQERHAFQRLAAMAGKIYGSGTAPTASTITARISAGLSYMNAKSVDAANRTVFINAEGYQLLVDSGKTLYASKGIVDKAWAKGKVDEYGGADIVMVPDDEWPANLNFLIVQKTAAVMPFKLKNTRIMEDAQIDGDVLRNHYIFDAFVIGRRCDGVYADFLTGSGKATVLNAPSVTAAGVITAGSGTTGTMYYTTDGSDPRYSVNRMVAAGGSSAVAHTAGDTIKVYTEAAAGAEGVYASPVVSVKTTS